MSLYLSLLGFLLTAGLVIWGAVAFGRWLKRSSIEASYRWWAQQRLWRAQQRARQQWLQARVAPHQSRVRSAAIYVGLTLAVALAAPLLFLLLGRLIGAFEPDVLHATTANALVAAISGLVIATAVSVLREKRIALAEKLLNSLAGGVVPDGSPKLSVVDFWPMTRDWNEGTIKNHYGIEMAPKRASEWLVALNQVGGAYRGNYTLQFLKMQIEALERRRDEARQDCETASRYGDAKCPPPPPPEPKWVCFVSLNGRFHAMQPWAMFRYQIITKENATYLHILNASTEEAFATEIKRNMDRTRPQADDEEPKIFPNAIPGLECFWIEAGTTTQNALTLLTEKNKGRAMVVYDKNGGEPWGTVTLNSLVDTVLCKTLRELELDGQQARNDRSDTTPPGFVWPKKTTTPA